MHGLLTRIGQVAELMRAGKMENAKIRVELVLQFQAVLEAFDILELFCELLSVRMAIIHKQK